MDQAMEASRSVDSVVSDYPVNMINGTVKNERVHGHWGLNSQAR